MRAAEQYRNLEFDRVLEQLAGFAQSEVTRELIRNIEVVFHPGRIDENLDQTTEALRFAADKPAVDVPSFSSVSDIRELLQRISLGELPSSQDARALLAYFDTARAFDSYTGHLDHRSYPRLADAAASWQSLDDLRALTQRVFSEEGEVKDSASPELQRIRIQLRRFEGEAKSAVRDTLTQIRDSSGEEGLITIRNHRFVVLMPRSELKNHSGSVVDVSATGQSVYFEPAGLAKANLERQHLFLDEDTEVRRVLREYGSALSLRMPSLLANLGVLVRFDYIHARGRYAAAIHANRPAMSASGGFILRRAVHPLLYRDFVPEDLTFDSERALIISGVNAGGKTVLLKLLGLYSLMAALGCYVPGDAQLPYLGGVSAYIGDEQSTQHHLSTFTAHLRFVKELWAEIDRGASVGGDIASPRDQVGNAGGDKLRPYAKQTSQAIHLVLIDEVGTGTEPGEGQAFAYGLITALLDQPVKLAVTTHFDLLKVVGLERGDVKNVSLQFDEEQLKPTYRVLDHQPGRSFALAIARRWGIPAPVVDAAEGVLGQEERRMASVIGELEKLRRTAEEANAQARRQAEEVETIRAENEELALELRRAKSRFAQQSERMKGEIKRQIEELLSDTKRKLRNKARQATRRHDEYVKAASKTAQVGRNQEAEAEELVDAMLAELDIRPGDVQPAAAADTSALQVGDEAIVEGSGVRGEIVELSEAKREAVLLVTGKRMTIKLSRLQRAAPREAVHDPLAAFRPAKGSSRQWSQAGVSAAASTRSTYETDIEGSYTAGMQDSADTLDLHGHTVEEATEKLDEFISRALLADVSSIRIMHGVGTGRLRTFVQDYLRRNGHVTNPREAPLREGGKGVTLADLK